MMTLANKYDKKIDATYKAFPELARRKMKKNYVKNFDRSARESDGCTDFRQVYIKNGRQIDDGSIDVNESQSSIWT